MRSVFAASELYGSLETPSVESLVSWLLEHPHIPQEDSDSDSNSYDIHSDTDSMSDDFGDQDSFEVMLGGRLWLWYCRVTASWSYSRCVVLGWNLTNTVCSPVCRNLSYEYRDKPALATSSLWCFSVLLLFRLFLRRSCCL